MKVQPLPVKYLSLADAAAELGLSRDYLRQCIHRGVLRATKIGRNWCVTKQALETFRARKEKGEA